MEKADLMQALKVKAPGVRFMRSGADSIHASFDLDEAGAELAQKFDEAAEALGYVTRCYKHSPYHRSREIYMWERK